MPHDACPMPDRSVEPGGPRARLSLSTKVIVGAVTLVTISTGLCGYLTATLAARSLNQTLHRDARLLAESLARGVGLFPEHDRDARLHRMIDDMPLDQRIAFVTVTDAADHIIARRIADPDAFAHFTRRLGPDGHLAAAHMNSSVAIAYRADVDLIVATQPIWAPVGPDDPPRLDGRLVLAMSDPGAASMMGNFRAAVIGVVCVICLLCIPAIVYTARRWAQPLRRMLLQTRQLAEGHNPQPVPDRQNDEVGRLARAFNAMAAKLSSARTELIAANRDLERQVEQRTEQLRNANELLTLQMQDKDEFIRAVTHDLNAPVRNIAGMARILLMKHRSDLNADALAKLERIAANAKAEGELLADLLELSRIRSQPGKIQRVELGELIGSISDGLAFDLESKGIALRIADDLPVIQADRNRVRQVFQNLLDNAIKYMPPDHTERRIEVGCEPGDGQAVLFVRDTGCGIAEKDHERVFQVFQRARYSGDLAAPGRGVGLASVKTIIETGGGRIWVDSQPGRGTTFYFTFGRTMVPDAPAPAPAAAVHDADLSPSG
jgi:signal transduction histidine kinase